MSFRLPDKTKRLTITGRTGSGKTVFGAWVLSEANFDEMPWVIMDFKGDELLGSIEYVKDLVVTDHIPHEPGLYRMKPDPVAEDDINEFMFRVWRTGSVGLFIDETYMVPNPLKRNGLKAVLTQGRALHIPVIALSQRPSGVNRHVFSEADMFCSYHLNDKKDRERVGELTPDDEVWDQDARLPDFHSRWYDVGYNWSAILKPVPNPEKILQRFRSRLEPPKETVDNTGQSDLQQGQRKKVII
jgi:hypothetical protein